MLSMPALCQLPVKCPAHHPCRGMAVAMEALGPDGDDGCRVGPSGHTELETPRDRHPHRGRVHAPAWSKGGGRVEKEL